MEKITNTTDLKNAIQQLEYLQATDWALLKNEFHKTQERLKPINIIKNTFKELISTPDLKTQVANAAIGFTTGVIAKKVLVGKTNNPLTKLLGMIVEIVVANKAAKNADTIKSIGSTILKKLTGKQSDSEKV